MHYRKRNSKEPFPIVNKNPKHILLTYCNWSYAKNKHIDIQTLKEILTTFTENKIHFYLRIINETPIHVVYSFIKREELKKSDFKSIYDILKDRNFDLKEIDFKEI